MKNYTKHIGSKYLQLQSSLSQFGLCPNDWNIEPQKNDFILIKNKTEESFYFIGKIKQKTNSDKIDWKFITLASL
jgi:hypothetical protein